MLFVPGPKDGPVQKAVQQSQWHKNTFLIGPEECVAKITIEASRNERTMATQGKVNNEGHYLPLLRSSCGAFCGACAVIFCWPPVCAQSVDENGKAITFHLTRDDTDGLPVQMVHRMFRSNPACPSAKLDLWFNDGSLRSMLFVPGPSNTKNQIGNVSSFGNASVFTIGPTECRFKVTIEAVETNKPPPTTSEQQEHHD